MFTVAFIRYIFDADGPNSKARFAVFERELELPFAPTVGQEIRWVGDGPFKVASCTWHFDYSRFWCKLEDEFPDNVSWDAFSFDELVERAKSSGWPLIEIFEPE